MRSIVARTICGMCTYVVVVISPATQASPVVTSVSHATRAAGSSVRMASRTASEIWSAILSGCPSVTDSDVNSWRSRTSYGVREELAGRPESGRLKLADDIPFPHRGQPAVQERCIAEGRMQTPAKLPLRGDGRSRGQCSLGRFDRDVGADAADEPLHERHGTRRNTELTQPESDERERHQRLRCHLAADADIEAVLPARFDGSPNEPQHGRVQRGEPR